MELLFTKMSWYSQLRRTIFSWWAPGALRLWLWASTMARIRLRNHRWLPVASIILRPFVVGTLAKKLFFFWKLLQDSQQSFSTQRSYITHRICLGFRFQSWEEEVYSQVTGWHIPFTKGIHNRVLQTSVQNEMAVSMHLNSPLDRIMEISGYLLSFRNLLAHCSTSSPQHWKRPSSCKKQKVPCKLPWLFPSESVRFQEQLGHQKRCRDEGGWRDDRCHLKNPQHDQGWHQPNPTKPWAPALRSTLHLPKASTLTHLGMLETPAWW